MDPVTMMVASIGLQFFNNYVNNRKNRELQAHQREVQSAALRHDIERMRKAQAAAARVSLELDTETHQERLSEIEKSYDTLIANFAHSFAVSNWPLNVLPFIMRGESFGGLMGGSSRAINIHCILTPSNCPWFNEYFYDDLDLRIETEMNNTWNAQSTHPIVYYGGGWNRRENRSNGRSTPSLIDLDDITLLKNQLRQIPTLVITPYFDPYLYLKVHIWGMGKDSQVPFRIDIPHGEIEPSGRLLSYDYNKDKKEELTDDFFETTMEEMVPLLTCLIGFVADKYFWSLYGVEPILPKYILQTPALIERIYKEKYALLAREVVHKETNGTLNELTRMTTFIDAVSPIMESKCKEEVERAFVAKVHNCFVSFDDKPIPDSYKETVSFLQREQALSNSLNWVPRKEFDDRFYERIHTERLDLIEYIHLFEDYLDQNNDRFCSNDISLYIEQFNFKTFWFHVYDMKNKQVLQAFNGFAYLVETNEIKHPKNVKTIFKYENHNSISCRRDRITKLIERINDKSLTY